MQEGQKLLQEVGWPVDRLAKEVREKRAELEMIKAQMAASSTTRTGEWRNCSRGLQHGYGP